MTRIAIRSARLPEDIAAIRSLDSSFECGRYYEVERAEFSFRLVERSCDPPITKRYPVSTDERAAEQIVIAENGDVILGAAKVSTASWNRRAEMEDIVVSGAHRGRGIATLLMRVVERRARAVGARVLWLETQNTNFPAIQFYRRVGFRLCGLDDTLYDVAYNTEVALFFSRALEEA